MHDKIYSVVKPLISNYSQVLNNDPSVQGDLSNSKGVKIQSKFCILVPTYGIALKQVCTHKCITL